MCACDDSPIETWGEVPPPRLTKICAAAVAPSMDASMMVAILQVLVHLAMCNTPNAALYSSQFDPACHPYRYRTVPKSSLTMYSEDRNSSKPDAP
uniref:Uncharacterized protein n=1 Tax=Parascaris equorum TaxID=6256 RepID=A0A914R4J8_PAREQ